MAIYEGARPRSGFIGTGGRRTGFVPGATLAPPTLQAEKNSEWFLKKLWIRGLLTEELVETRDATKCPALSDALRQVVAIRQFFIIDDPDADIA